MTEDSLPDAIPGPIQGAFYGSPFDRLRYDGTSKTYFFGNDVNYGPSDLVSSGPNEQVYRKSVRGLNYEFNLTAPSVGNRLVYTRLAFQRYPLPPSYNQQISYYYFLGVPTKPTDVPNVVSVNFPVSSAVYGEAYRLVDGKRTRYMLGESAATLSVNLATGSATVRLSLKGRSSANGTLVELGSYSTTGTIDPSNAAYQGSSTDSAQNAFTTWCGFFGPQGVESACYFSLTHGVNGSMYQRDLFIIGTVAWRR